MRGLLQRLVRQPARAAIAADASAIVLFALAGLLSHEHGLSLRGLGRDVLPFLGAWAAASLALRTYRRPGGRALAATWAVAIPVGVLVRALVLGRSLDGKQASFLAVALVTTGLFVVGARAVAVALAARPGLRRGAEA